MNLAHTEASGQTDDRPTPRALLDAARRELTDDTVCGRGGRVAVDRYARRIDELLQRLVVDAPPPGRPVAVVALGGYGRRHLCLHSDIDVLVVFDGSIGPEDERFVRGILHPLWDLGLAVGHQVREIKDFAELEVDNPEFVLALTDARPVAGEPSLFDRFQTMFGRWQTHAYVLDALQQLIVQRHAQFNDTLYQLEPDLKDAPGGLRDLTAIDAIARVTNPAILSRVSAARGLVEAEDFLLRIRSILHFEARRNQNVLSHEIQERAAHLLGYSGTRPQQRVERLMGDYFRHARAVSRSLERVRAAAPRPVGANLVCSRDGIELVDLAEASVRPETWIDIFQTAVGLERPVADETLAWIQQHVNEHDAEAFFPSQAAGEAFVRFLKPRAGLYARLSEMHDCGMLGRLFPEFQAISWRVVRDFYHKYTVDEHTLLTVRNLERLTVPNPAHGRFSSLLADLQAPELLVLSLVFHDVGKWRDEDHALESVRMAHNVLDRLSVPPESRDVVEFLIRNHLRMSIAAFRRDTEDPEIVKQLASLVGTEERLKLLCLMTLADVGAVSPDTLTPWREELLWRLYVDTYNHLTLGYADELIDRGQAGLAELMASRPSDLSEGEITRFLEGLPRRYLDLFSREAIYRHVWLSRDILPDQVHVSLEHKAPGWELAVVTLDKPFLFSNVCGVLSSFGMDILKGHALTNPNGLVLDIFQFRDEERFLELNADGREQLIHELEEAVSGRSDVALRLRARALSILVRRGIPRTTATVHADNHSSRRYTILDIIASNRIGLLHRISRVISQHGCDVDLVLISTEGEKAVDVFHITQGGDKLSEAAQQAITADLQRMLEDTDEVD